MVRLRLEREQYQWNTDQRIIVTGIDGELDKWIFHFDGRRFQEYSARPKVGGDGVTYVEIPNRYFHHAGTVMCYGFDDGSGRTKVKLAINIRPKQKPDGYIYEGIQPDYIGETVITPEVNNEIVLPTKDKVLRDNITCKKIPVFEVSNGSGGMTLIIGRKDIEIG